MKKLLLIALLSATGFAHASLTDQIYKPSAFGLFTQAGYSTGKAGGDVDLSLGFGYVIGCRTAVDASVGVSNGMSFPTNHAAEVERVVRRRALATSLGLRYALDKSTDLRAGLTFDQATETLETGTLVGPTLEQKYTETTTNIFGGRLGFSREVLPGLAVYVDVKLRKSPAVVAGVKWGF